MTSFPINPAFLTNAIASEQRQDALSSLKRAIKTALQSHALSDSGLQFAVVWFDIKQCSNCVQAAGGGLDPPENFLHPVGDSDR